MHDSDQFFCRDPFPLGLFMQIPVTHLPSSKRPPFSSCSGPTLHRMTLQVSASLNFTLCSSFAHPRPSPVLLYCPLCRAALHAYSQTTRMTVSFTLFLFFGVTVLSSLWTFCPMSKKCLLFFILFIQIFSCLRLGYESSLCSCI